MSLRSEFEVQAKSCAALGSPFMARLMPLIGQRLEPGTPVADRVLNWPGDGGVFADNVPMRLGGALHALKLEGLALGDVYPPHEVPDDALWDAVRQAMSDHADRVLDWLSNAPQTNEVRRASAILPALTEIARRFDRPMSLIELGTSGGLNLQADRMAVEIGDICLGDPESRLRLRPDWTGPTPEPATLQIVSRQGIDLSPIDPTSAEGRLTLLAYLWADQPDRIERTKAAIALATSNPPKIHQGDAADCLAVALASAPAGTARVIFHSVAWQYFPEATKARTTALIEAAALTATPEAPLAWFSMEADEEHPGAGLNLHLWPGDGGPGSVGRADFHGRWVNWFGLPDAV